MAGSSVPGSGQAVSMQLDCLRSNKYIWLRWLPDAIKAAKALKRWCLRDPRLHWSEMRLRLCPNNTPTLSSPPCICNCREEYNECQPNLCLLNQNCWRMWKSKPSGKCCPPCVFAVFTSNGGIEFDWSGQTWEIGLLIQTDCRVWTACLCIPWSPLGPLQPNSAVMAFLGDLMSPRATCVSWGGRRGLVPQLQPLSRGSGRCSMSATTPIASTSQPQTAMFTEMALIQPYDGVSSPVTTHFRGNLLASAPISNLRHNVLFVLCRLTHSMTESLLSLYANIILPSALEKICLTLSFLTIVLSLKTVGMLKG